MKKVTVLRLSGCSYCEELVEKLEANSIPYIPIDANENGKLADKIEALLNTDIYPIVILEINNNPPFFIFRAKDYDEIGESVVEGGVKVGAISIDAIVEIISNLI